MIGDFDPNGHKNLELFRYYLNRDLQRIDNSIQDNHGELKGYFVASLVDILIVFLFSEDLRTREIQTSVYKGYKQDKIEMRGDRAEMSDFPLYLNTVAGGLDRRDQAIGGFSFVVKIYAVPVVEIIG